MTIKRRELYIHILGEKTLMKRFKLKHKVKGNILNATHPTIFWGWHWKERHTIASETFSFNRCEHRPKIKGIRNHVLEKKALSFVTEKKCFLLEKKALITVSRLSGIFRRLFIGVHNFLSGKRIGSHIGSASSNIQHILWLISSFKQRDVGEILVGLQGRWTSIYYFL